MKNQHEDSGNTIFLLICLMVGVLLLVPAWYAKKAGIINVSLLELAKVQLLAFTPFSDEALTAWGRIAEADPAALTWDQVMNVVRYSGKWIRWPYALVLAALGIACIFMSRTGGLIRRLNMDSLLRNNAESFPCLRPIVGRGKTLLSPESYDSGPWCIARSPVQFALEHGLLLNKDSQPFTPEQALRRGLAHVDLPAYGHAHLDEAKAADVLRAQLGKRFAGFKAMSAERKALAAAFLAYGVGDKQACLHLLDAVSASYTEKDGPACLVLEKPAFQKDVRKAWNAHKKRLGDPLLKRHAAFELPWFMAALTLARRKGVLASSQFLWVRPVDRPLWYALNQCGGRAAWAEGFAAWAHYAAEEKAGKTLREPRLTHAAGRLRDTLAAQGWLTDVPRLFESSGLNLDTNVTFAPAEAVQEDYDANEDPSLKDEF